MTCGCKAARTIANGVVGLTVSAVGPTAAPEVIAERTEVCRACKDRIFEGRRAICRRCRCYLPAKRRIRKPGCPKWIR